MTVKTRKKLIEVALPLEAINAASAREKSIRHGHPSTLHLWWARRPLAAARAVIFAQMVDDPSSYVDTLLGVPETRRAAERELKKRRELWAKRKAEHEAARQRGGRRAGARSGADARRLRRRHRAPTPVSHRRGARQVGEHHQRGGADRRRVTRSGRAGGAPAPIMPAIRAPRNCSIATSCRPSTIPSPAAARCRWRRSGWG